MALFVVIGLDDQPQSIAKRDSLRPQHRAYVRGDQSRIRFVGPIMNDDNDVISGSLYLYEADTAEQILEWFKDEPFYKAGVYKQFLIRPFEVRKCDIPFTELR